jgi:hypothetical protein
MPAISIGENMNNKRLFIMVFVMLAGASTFTRAADLITPPCREPFCTYAPPKLSGDDMAAAVRKLITSAKDPIYRLPFNSNERDPVKMHTPDPVMKDFVANKNFKFLTPSLVIESRSDPRLQEMFGEECLLKLTQDNYTKKPNGLDSGPFYFYDVKTTAKSKTTYKAVIIYGIDSTIYLDDEIGRFIIFKPNTKCDALYKMSIRGADRFRHRAESQKYSDRLEYAPIFSGLAYYKNDLFYYKATGDIVGEKTDPSIFYGLAWYNGLLNNSKGSLLFKENGSADISPLPKSFDPFSLLNKENFR